MKLLGFVSALLLVFACSFAQDNSDGSHQDASIAMAGETHAANPAAPRDLSSSEKTMLNQNNVSNDVRPSDIRAQKNTVKLEPVLNKLDVINAFKFDWKKDGKLKDENKDRHIGLIAQEVEQVFPELVSKTNDGYKAVDYAKLTAVLLEAIKELKAENTILKHRLDNIEYR